MHHHLDLLQRHVKEPSGFDDFQPLVHHGRRIDGDLASHGPVGMVQRLLQRHLFQLLQAVSPERSAGRRQQDPADLIMLIALQALENSTVLTVHRQHGNTVFLHSIHYQLSAGN